MWLLRSLDYAYKRELKILVEFYNVYFILLEKNHFKNLSIHKIDYYNKLVLKDRWYESFS